MGFVLVVFVLLELFSFCFPPQDESFIVGIEYFDLWLDIVELIFGCNGTLNCLILHKPTSFFFHVDDPDHSAKVIEYVVEAFVGIDGRNGTDEQNL